MAAAGIQAAIATSLQKDACEVKNGFNQVSVTIVREAVRNQLFWGDFLRL